MKNLLPRFIVVLLSLLLVAPAAAQEEATNLLLDMLAFVPDTAEIMQSAPIVNFVDYRQVEAGRDLNTPTLQHFENETNLSFFWIASMEGVVTGSDYIDNFMEGLNVTGDVVGFTLLDVDQSVTFGRQPSTGLVFAGDFDTVAIGAVFASRSYVEQSIEGFPVWCSSEGCDEGTKMNLRERDNDNPFGGRLGKREPIAVLPDYIVNSTQFSLIEESLAAYGDRADSLADNPTIRAGVQAAANRLNIRQMQFYNNQTFGVIDHDRFLESYPVNAFDEAPVIPPYEIMFIADTWYPFLGENIQVAAFGLVYNNLADATLASHSMPSRLSLFASPGRLPLNTLIEDFGGIVQRASVFYSRDTGKYVAITRIFYATPANTINFVNGGNPTDPSGLLYRLVTSYADARDLGWLAHTSNQ